MRRAAKMNPQIAARVKLFQYRVPEEFYDYEHDPAALHNLMDDPRYREIVRGFRARMRRRMQQLGGCISRNADGISSM